MTKKLLILIILNFSIIFFKVLFASDFDTTKDTVQLTKHEKTLINIAVVGDIMMGTNYPTDKLPPNEGRDLFSQAKNVLLNADIAFGNLEGPLCDGGISKKIFRDKRSYVFRTPTKYVTNLIEAGFDVLSLANNHAADFGQYGLNSTKKTLDSVGIKYSSKDGEVAEFNINDVKIGLIAMSCGAPPRSIVYPSSALSEINNLSKKYDILIVSIHAGKEGGKSALHVKDEPEYFLGEQRGNPLRFAHDAISNGADLIIMHGPHVPRAIELFNNKLIAYSLGNFCTYRAMNLLGENGYAPLLSIKIDKEGNFINGKIHSFIQTPPGGPKLDVEKKSLNLIKNLSLADFPQSPIIFDTTGLFK